MASALDFYGCYTNLTGISTVGGEGASCMQSVTATQPASSGVSWKASHGVCFIAVMTTVVSQVL